MKKIAILSTFALSISLSTSFAQQGIHPSGGNASGAGGSVSYSVGQVFYSSQNGTDASLIQGVQQPYELMITDVKDLASNLLSCEVFPNPAVKELNLLIKGEQPENGNWNLFDSKGVTIRSGKISTKETLIPMAGVPTAAYTLKVFSGKKELKIFKILKQ
jgi:hypothetical protein